MKLFIKSVFITILLAIAANTFAQPSAALTNAQPNNYIPELVFQNPTLISGSDKQNGAVYKFANVAPGIDAMVIIVGRSSSAVVLDNIDVSDMGWNKAFQPQLGIQGNVPAYQDWWMEFQVRFYKAGTNNKTKIKGFQVTAIDVDGDGVSIQEYLQMNRTSSWAASPVTYLSQPAITPCLTEEDEDDNSGTDKKIMGPVQNYINIDTLGTPVMSTFTFQNKDMISFRYGAKSGAVISNAGERLNSLWFKAFSLQPLSTLPVTFHSFNVSYNQKTVSLDWTSDTDDNFSYYFVERSTDGKSYSEIGKVATTGKQLSTYHFTDAASGSTTGVLFYRLRWVTVKEAVYSPIHVVKLNNESTAQLTTYPNPVVSDLRVSLPNTWQGKQVQIELYSANGTRVQSLPIGSASQTENIQVGSLSRGMYIVKATSNGQTLEQRIIKN